MTDVPHVDQVNLVVTDMEATVAFYLTFRASSMVR